MPTKTKTPQKETPDEFQSRDFFQTPNYATDLLVPFIERLMPKDTSKFIFWECASGGGKILNRLKHHGINGFGTDLNDSESFNFLTDMQNKKFNMIITNPPFSLKKKFFERCYYYKVPFALLVSADYTGWGIDALIGKNSEKIIPNRRVDYITPFTLQRIHEGEVWSLVKPQFPEYKTLKKFREKHEDQWNMILKKHPEHHNYKNIDVVPSKLLRKYSSSDFHSMWLTWGFGLGKSETFVELTNSMKDNI